MSSFFNRDDQALHGVASFFKKSSDEEARARYEADGVPDQAWREGCLPRYRKAPPCPPTTPPTPPAGLGRLSAGTAKIQMTSGRAIIVVLLSLDETDPFHFQYGVHDDKYYTDFSEVRTGPPRRSS